MERLENWAIGQGIREIRLWANIDIGGYAWTLYGFDFDIRYPYGVSGLPDIVRIAESIVRSGHFSPEGLRDWQVLADRAAREAWYRPERVTAYEIGRIGWDARHLDDDGRMTWDGKELLRNSGWQGVRHLEPPTAPRDPIGPRDTDGPVASREPDGRSDVPEADGDAVRETPPVAHETDHTDASAADHPAAPVAGDHSPGTAHDHAPFSEWGDRAGAIEAALPTPHELPGGETLRSILDNGVLEVPRQGFESWLNRVLAFDHLASGVHTRLQTWSLKPDVLTLRGSLLHGDEAVGFYERSIRLSSDDELIASHDFAYVADADFQSHGFGSAWNEHLENWYISQGVKEVRLLANVDVGGYAWSRSFDFSEQPGMSRFGTPTMGEPAITWQTSEFRSLVGWVERHIADGRMSEQGRMDWERLRERATQDAWEQGYRLTPAEFARIGWDARTVTPDGRMMWDGKRILLEFGKDVHEGGGGGWHGVRRLVPPGDPIHGVPGESGSHSVSSHDQDAPPSGSEPGAPPAGLPAGPHEVTGLGPEFRSTAQDHQALRDAMGEERYEDRRYNADMSAGMDREGGAWADPLYSLPAEARAEVYARIPEADRVALYDYTGSAFNRINEALRSGDLAVLAHHAAQIRCIVSALNHLPIHEGPVERNIYAPSEELPGVLARYERGAVVTEETFISTSPDPDGVQSGNVRFTIESRTGREILPGLSGDPGEREILFPPGSRFEVTRVEPTAEGAHIHLRELPPEPGLR
jgi:ADP-ribosyltransferase exoenzyme